MKFKQEKEFKPLTITLETQEEYDSMARIIDEALDKNVPAHMDDISRKLAVELSNRFSHNV